MNFNTLSFGVFFLGLLALYALPLLPWRGKKALLLGGSYFFYCWWDPTYLVLILASTLIDYVCGAKIGASDNPALRKRLLVVSLVSNLGILGIFKYFNFFAENFAVLLAALGMKADAVTLEVLLPVGISFYTFQSMSYTIDLYRKKIEPAPSLLDFALFVAFFPQLVAGPIVRASEFLVQLASPRRITAEGIQTGGFWIVTGYLFKVGVADNLASSVDFVFNAPEAVLASEAWLASYYFAFQIFGDFCGYTLIARGVAKVMGFDLPENFRTPYLARNFSDFWRRWHISLSTWLRDYLYISLGGNRSGSLATTRNLMITMILGGLWHGANWTFLLWGFLHGLYLVVQRLFTGTRPRESRSLVRDVLAILVVFHLVLVCWVVFRAASVGDAWILLTKMLNPVELFQFHMPNKLLLKDGVWMIPMLVYHLWVFTGERRGTPLVLRPAAAAVGLAACLFVTIVCREASDAFIYFQF